MVLRKAIELPIDETEILISKPANKLLAPSISALLARAHVWTLNTTIDDATLRLSFLRDTPLIPTSYLHGQDFRPIFRRNRRSNWRNPLLQQQSTRIPTPRIHSRLRSDIMHGYYSEGLLCLGGCWRIGATHRSLSTALGWLVNSHYLYGLPSGWSKVVERFFSGSLSKIHGITRRSWFSYCRWIDDLMSAIFFFLFIVNVNL